MRVVMTSGQIVRAAVVVGLLAVGLSGCVYAPPPGPVAYGPGAYGPAPGYYYGPSYPYYYPPLVGGGVVVRVR